MSTVTRTATKAERQRTSYILVMPIAGKKHYFTAVGWDPCRKMAARWGRMAPAMGAFAIWARDMRAGRCSPVPADFDAQRARLVRARV